MSSLIKNILFALALAVILWLGYTVFLAEDENPGLSQANTIVSTEAARDTQEFLRKLQQLRTINIESTVFTDPRFRSFVDYRQEIVDEPVGRDNPFAPIGQ